MKKRDHGKVAYVLLIIIGALGVLGGVAYGVYLWQQSQVVDLKGQVTQLQTQLSAAQKQANTQSNDVSTYTSSKGVTLKVFSPSKNAVVSSPIVILGEVPGNWSFEASFPVTIKDARGNIIASAPAQLIGDWMTTALVPFSLKLPYDSAVSGEGSLVLQKDNPSGLPENDDSVVIPILFR